MHWQSAIEAFQIFVRIFGLFVPHNQSLPVHSGGCNIPGQALMRFLCLRVGPLLISSLQQKQLRIYLFFSCLFPDLSCNTANLHS